MKPDYFSRFMVCLTYSAVIMTDAKVSGVNGWDVLMWFICIFYALFFAFHGLRIFIKEELKDG